MPQQADYVERVRTLVLDRLRDHPAAVYFFGSRATGEARHHSDVDVAVDARGELPRYVLAELREALEESTIPYRVDVVDLRDASLEFRQKVLREGILWRDWTNG